VDLSAQPVPIKFNNNNNNPSIAPIHDPKYPMIHNLARIILSTHEKYVLNLGMKFCPVPQSPKAVEYEMAMNELRRKLLLKAYFMNEDTDDVAASPVDTLQAVKAFQEKLKTPSKWVPQRHQCHPILYNFTEELYEKLKNTHTHHSSFQNLNKHQRKALKKLQNRHDIVIKQSDKGGGVCILTSEQYEKEALRQLENKEHYQEVPPEMMTIIKNRIQDAIKTYTLTGALKPKTANLLPVSNSVPGRFYLLPKIHKDQDNPPGRPIVSSNQHPTENLSLFVDEHLKAHVQDIPSYVKDSSHFIDIDRKSVV
jgi:hypothetical protein